MPQLENFALTMDSNFVLGSVPLIVVVKQKQFSMSSKEIRNKCFEFPQRRQNETPISHRNEGNRPHDLRAYQNRIWKAREGE